MNRLLNLFRASRPAKPATSRRPQRARLQLESLEERWMPSASSTAIHAVTDYTGASVAFFYSNGSLFEKTDQGLVQKISTLQNHSLSAGLDYQGFAEVYLQTGYNTISFRSDATSAWQSTTEPGQQNFISTFAAVKGGRMYVVNTNGSVWQFQSPYSTRGFVYSNGHSIPVTITHAGGWSEILGLYSFSQFNLEAVTDVNNHDNLFTELNDGISEFVPGVTPQVTPIVSGFKWGQVFNSFTFSAGLDTNGLADLFIKTVDSDQGTSLWKWTSVAPNGANFIPVTGFGYNDTISATTGGMCFFTVLFSGAHYNTIGQFDPHTGVTFWPSQPFSETNIAQLSAAGANDVFAIGADGIVEEFGFAVPNGHRDYGFPA